MKSRNLREAEMNKNMGNLDRGLRLLAAALAVVVAVVVGAGSIAGIVLFVIAAMLLATSAVAFCPLYRLLHLDTCARRPLLR
jgi:Flp pilus assembly protein TadB